MLARDADLRLRHGGWEGTRPGGEEAGTFGSHPAVVRRAERQTAAQLSLRHQSSMIPRVLRRSTRAGQWATLAQPLRPRCAALSSSAPTLARRSVSDLPSKSEIEVSAMGRWVSLREGGDHCAHACGRFSKLVPPRRGRAVEQRVGSTYGYGMETLCG